MTCAKDVEFAFGDFKLAIMAFQHKDEHSIRQGFVNLGLALEPLVEAMGDCGHAYSEVMNLVNAIKSFTDPFSFLWHTGKELIINHADIYDNFVAAQANWENKKWEEFGRNIGDIIADITYAMEEH
jgi:hypothetical protein